MDLGLAKSLLPSVYVLYAVLIIASLLALWQLLFTLAAFSKPAESPEANRIKVWFSVLFPKSAVQFLIPFLAVVPQLLPQYVIGRFAEYYRDSGMENNAPTYYDYSARAVGFNPLLFSVLLACASAVVFFAVRGLEKKHMLDMYRRFEKAPETMGKQRRRY
ncbi:MAG: hypothetical protein MJ137_06385 [Clostridia bacterium]|nr:hypothetical protein [Clostridia bacterium]